MESLLRLRRYLETPEARAPEPGQACELCGAPVGQAHPHVLETAARRFLCSCRACYLLFTHAGAAGGRYRSIPDRYLKLTGAALDPAQFGIPVAVAFFFRISAAGRVLAFYPSPAGATESALPAESWEDTLRAYPALTSMEQDVEALLVWNTRGRAESWIVPVDACYELVGRIRKRWRGFDGGAEVWREIDAFFAAAGEREQGRAPWLT
jgi:hypothetical protein